MKIIQAGQAQPGEGVRWWVGRHASCSVCGAKVQYEQSDPVASVATANGRVAEMPCQTQNCKGVLSVKE